MEEIEYLDTKFISLMNLFNNISFTNYKVVSEEIKSENKNSSGSSSEDGEGKNYQQIIRKILEIMNLE